MSVSGGWGAPFGSWSGAAKPIAETRRAGLFQQNRTPRTHVAACERSGDC